VLQPQVISPKLLMESLIKSVSAFPKDTILPFPLSKNSTHLLLRVCKMQVYIKKGLLGYVILLLLVNRGTFSIYKLISMPMPLDKSKFLYIDTGKSFLWLDEAGQFYFVTNKDWLDACRVLDSRSYVCKQNQPLLSSHLHENCMVTLLHPRSNITHSCDKRVVEISNSVWTQLEKNEWIYFVPTIESITILRTDRAPTDVTLTGIGKLGIVAGCRGYSKSALLQTHSVSTINGTKYESDIISKVNLEYDCYEELGVKFNISSIRSNSNFEHIMSNLDDLQIVSHKVSDIEQMLKDQEWKRSHTVSHDTYSMLVYICLILIVLYATYKLYKCLKKRVGCVRAIAVTSGSGNVVNIKIHTRNESLAVANEDIPLRELNSLAVEPKVRRSSRLRTSKSCF
jgi:hypothetical protein